jgi:LysM repeat protein
MKHLVIFFSLAVAANAWSKQLSKQEYINQWKNVAQNNMAEYKIPASIILAQGILESSFGNSDLARKANNHFGIKCHSTWSGERFYQDDDAKNECFRSYPNASESYKDHALFLTSRSRYSSLFSLDIKDYKAWAHGLKKAGYATHPEYASKLIRVIEENNLDQFDRVDFSNPTVEPVSQSNPVLLAVPNRPVNVSSVNNVQCVTAQKGETLYKIAKATGVSLSQLYKYNDFAEGQEAIQEGDIIYLQPKRFGASGKKFHTVAQQNMTLRKISQIEGVRLKSLLRKNSNLDADSELDIKTKVKL